MRQVPRTRTRSGIGKVDEVNAFIDATPIDIGDTAINRADSWESGYTYVSKANPANANGTLTNLEIWAASNITGLIVATFSASGDVLTPRDQETIGSVTAGSKQTFTINLNVQTGDYIGIYFASGSIEEGSGAGLWWKSGDQTNSGAQTFTLTADGTQSVYGTSQENNMDEEIIMKLMTDINNGFASIRKTMTDGFADANRQTTKLSIQFAKIDERIGNIRTAQTKLEMDMKDIKGLEDEVEKNTILRKKIERINWEIAKYVIWILLGAAGYGVAWFIGQGGFGG